MKRYLINSLKNLSQLLFFAFLTALVFNFSLQIKEIPLILLAIAIIIWKRSVFVNILLRSATPEMRGMPTDEEKENQKENYWNEGLNSIHPLLLLLFIFTILWSVPGIIIFWVINPESTKELIDITVFGISVVFGIIYYIRNKDKFHSLADKLTYFGFVLCVPVGVVLIFIK